MILPEGPIAAEEFTGPFRKVRHFSLPVLPFRQ
jgi:hypothetical protein